MFNNIQNDLCELLSNVEKAAIFDATIAARPDIVPAEKAYDEQRLRRELIEKTKEKYHLYQR